MKLFSFVAMLVFSLPVIALAQGNETKDPFNQANISNDFFNVPDATAENKDTVVAATNAAERHEVISEVISVGRTHGKTLESGDDQGKDGYIRVRDQHPEKE
jgi:hypothetical protein